jgi:flagellar motor protein MotB
VGESRRKQFFSDRRAKRVADFLIKLGVNPDTVSYRGFSDTRPVDTNSTAEGRSRNRRVEIIIVTR